MNETIIKNALAFLERVDLNWKEVPAYNEVINELLAELNKEEEIETDDS